MKRTLLQRGAIIAACAAAFVFAACGDDPEFDARTDTVYSLETPSVSAKAYPGVNVVSWNPVKGANGYTIYVYEDGIYKAESSVSGSYTYRDTTTLANGKNYTYYVEAKSATNPGTARAVYATNSRGEASVRAIVPPAGTKALELPAYENGYDGKTTKEVKNDDYVVNAANFKLEWEKDRFYLNFPVKAYLSYKVNIYKNDVLCDLRDISSASELASDRPNNTSMAVTKLSTTPGKYKVGLVVSAENGIYKEEVVMSSNVITIESLNLSSDTISHGASYLADGKTARIKFTPAVKDSANVPTSWYKVYCNEKGEYTTTPLTGTVMEGLRNSDTGKEREVYYYIDDTDADTTKTYEYTIVVTDGTAYGTAVTTTLKPRSAQEVLNDGKTFTNVLQEPKAAYVNDTTARISFTSNVKRNGAYAPADWYRVYRTIQNDLVVDEVEGEIKTIVSTDNSSKTAPQCYIDDTVPDTTKKYIYYLVVTDPDTLKYTVATTSLSPLSNSLILSSHTIVKRTGYLADGTTARISFTPAKEKGSTTYVDPTWYKVYRNEEDNNEAVYDEQTKLNGTIKVSNIDTTPTYYIDDTISDTTKTYKYTIAIEHDGKYGTAVTTSLSARVALNLKSQTGTVGAEYLKNVSNRNETNADKTVRIWFKPAVTNEDKPVDPTWYKVYRNEEGSLENEIELTKGKNVIATRSGSTTYPNSDTDIYYIEDTIPDPEKGYQYTVVVTNGTEYGTTRNGYLSAMPKSTIYISVNGQQEYDNENYTYKNSVKWDISGYNLKKADITSVKLCKVSRDRTNVDVVPVLISEYDAAELKNHLVDNTTSGSSYGEFELVTPVEKATYSQAYLLVKVVRDGYEDTFQTESISLNNY